MLIEFKDHHSVENNCHNGRNVAEHDSTRQIQRNIKAKYPRVYVGNGQIIAVERFRVVEVRPAVLEK